jgi:hypothetical protein
MSQQNGNNGFVEKATAYVKKVASDYKRDIGIIMNKAEPGNPQPTHLGAGAAAGAAQAAKDREAQIRREAGE